MRRANARSKEHAVAEGMAIAREMLDRVQPIVQGVQVSAPFGRAELALEVLAGRLGRGPVRAAADVPEPAAECVSS
jgi:homocysteine S-methyltransferase